MDGWINIGTKIDTKSFDAQMDYIVNQMEDIEDKLKQADMGYEVGDTSKLEAQYERLANRLTTLIQKQKELNTSNTSGMKGMVSEVSKVNSGLTKTIKKVGQWSLAIFGIRSVYLAIRQITSYISQYDTELAQRIENIKYTLAMAVQPVVERIVSIVEKLVQYIGYLAKAWWGVDIFAKKSEKSTKAAAKATKSLAGFDTANVLSDNKTSGTSATTLSPMADADAPKWLVWIKDHGNEVALIIIGIATAIGILMAVFDPVGTIIKVSIAYLLYFVTWLVKEWDYIKLGLKLLVTWIYEHTVKVIVDFFINAFTLLFTFFSNKIIQIKTSLETVKNFIIDMAKLAWNGIKTAFSGTITFFSGLWGKVRNIFTRFGKAAGNAVGTAFKTAINGALQVIETVLNAPIKAINGLLNVINKVPGVNIPKLDTFNLPRLATGGIINNPGKGVPVGGAIAGESGREGVLPLTDAQAMRELGKEIGQWISLNVDLTTKIDGRVLSRALEKVQNNNSFARNGV